MRTIGFLGTHGKTSTLYILESIFLSSGKKVGVIGDLGIRINKNKLPNTEISKALDSMKDEVEYLLIEIHEDQKVDVDTFDCIVLCDFQQFGQEKDYSFYRDIIKKSKLLVINADNSEIFQTIKGISGLYMITFGLNSKCTATASAISLLGGKTEYSYYLQRGFITVGKKEVEVQEIPIEIKLLGYHNILNTLGAITTALLYDIAPEEIADALKKIDYIPNRMELRQVKNKTFILDSAKDSYEFKMLFEVLQNLSYTNLDLIVTTDNIASLLESGTLVDFIDDFPLIKGAKIVLIGKPIRKKIDNEIKKNLINGVVQNKLNFIYEEDIDFYLRDNFIQKSENDIVVFIGFNDKSFINSLLNSSR